MLAAMLLSGTACAQTVTGFGLTVPDTATAIDLGDPAVACWRVEDEGSVVLALVNTHQTEAATVSLAELGALTLLGSVQASDSPAPALAEDGSVTLTAVSCLLLRAE